MRITFSNAPAATSLGESIPPQDLVPRVLCIDGASEISDRVRAALPGDEYELVFHDPSQRVEDEIEELEPDLLLIDLEQKTGSSFELCGELRAQEQARLVPIFLLSRAPLDGDQIARALICGADDCLVLEERPVEFQARVRVQLRNKRERDRLRRLKGERDAYRLEATIDALTGISNRRFINAELEDWLRRAESFAVLFIDVDHFKSVNDTFGHDVGDVVLKRVARALAETCASSERYGRYGGEEFVVLVNSSRSEDAIRAGERVRQAIADLPALAGDRRVTVSVGIAMHDGQRRSTVEALCKEADGALYEAKHLGRNRVVLAAKESAASVIALRSAVLPSTNAQIAKEVEANLLRELANGRAGLPLLPEAAQEALRLAEDPRTDMSAIAKLVERDPPLAARFVAIAGSAAYARGARLVSTQGALVRLGLAASRDLLLQVVYERTNGELPRYRAEVSRSFEHSVSTAFAAQRAAKELRITCEHAYLAGLLHDIGEARIYRVLSKIAHAPETGPELERLVTAHHATAGAEVGRAWRLPKEIIEVCLSHHGPPKEAPPTVRVVMAGEALVALGSSFDTSGELETPFDLYEDRYALLDALGLPRARAEMVARDLAEAGVAREEANPPKSSRAVRLRP